MHQGVANVICVGTIMRWILEIAVSAKVKFSLKPRERWRYRELSICGLRD